jgi:hypothetical protein
MQLGRPGYSTQIPQRLRFSRQKNAPSGVDLIAFKIIRCLSNEADANKDGKITAVGMQDYLPTKSSRHTMTLNRKQTTQ